MSLREQRDAEVLRIREALRQRVRASAQTQRSIEQANGFKTGYLSQVLQGHITLTVRHLIGILSALDESPRSFFARLDPDGERPADAGLLSEIHERMARYDAALAELESKGLIGGDLDADIDRDAAAGAAASPGDET